MDIIKFLKDLLGITTLENQLTECKAGLVANDNLVLAINAENEELLAENLELKERLIGLKDFETFADLEAWFYLHDELRMPAPNLCDDYSRESRALAEMDGYFLSCHLVYKGLVYGIPVFTPGDVAPNTVESVYHIANLAIVTDTEEVYYIDLAWGKLIKLCNFMPGGKY